MISDPEWIIAEPTADKAHLVEYTIAKNDLSEQIPIAIKLDSFRVVQGLRVDRNSALCIHADANYKD